jgi:ABC-type dipeptide/oligopeptide/nickel transport system permease subunit
VSRSAAPSAPLLLIGGGLLATLIVAGTFAPLLAPYDPRALAGDSLLSPSGRHLLGTNNVGQDIFSQIIWGARTSLVVALASAALSLAVGVLVGATAGLVAGWPEAVVMRVIDVFLAVPRLPLLVLVAALAGASLTSVVLVVGLLTWPVIARQVRAQTRSLRERGYLTAARGFGGGLGYLLRRHLVPALGPILVSGFVAVAANAVLLEASLAFLGLADPTGISWGIILNQALAEPGLYYSLLWTWWVLPAGFAITLAVLGFAFLGVALEPLLNPRWRRAMSA